VGHDPAGKAGGAFNMGSSSGLKSAIFYLAIGAIIFKAGGPTSGFLPVLLYAGAAYYLFSPLLVFGNMRIPLRVAYGRFNPADHKAGAEIERYLGEIGPLLDLEGFKLIEHPLRALGSTARANACISVYRNEAGERAHVAVVYHPSTDHTSSVVVLHTRFADGSERNTSNEKRAGVLPKRANRRGMSFPQVTDPIQLFRVHKALIARLEKEPIVPTPSSGSVDRDLTDEHEESYARLVEANYFRRDEAARVYLPTLYGAALITWRLIWPIGPIRHALMRARAARMLRELGL
jgi:hypothetical protein